MIFVTLDVPRKGPQNSFNLQKRLTNVEKVIKI
jgi:hypothetical protein